MTAALEFAKRNGSMEYVLCVEGFGWCADETSDYGGSENGFLGDVFVTADLNGDIATMIAGSSLTVHNGMKLPSSVGEKIDRLTLEKARDGITFELVDADDFIKTNMLPLSTNNETTLSTALGPEATTVVLTAGGSFATGATAWTGGRELVKLGTRSGSGPHTYTGCTRGYLGTPIGRVDDSLSRSGMTWKADVIAQSRCRFLHGRRVRLYAHAPGVTAANGGCMLIYSGAMRGEFTSDRAGVLWSIGSAAEDVSTANKVRKVSDQAGIIFDHYVKPNGEMFEPTSMPASGDTPNPPPANGGATGISLTDAGAGVKILARLVPYLEPGSIGLPGTNYELDAAIGSFYHYRSEPGGTAGIMGYGNRQDPQAPTVDGVSDIIDRWLFVDGQVMRAVQMFQSANDNRKILIDPRNPFGAHHLQFSAMPASGSAVRFLIDNISDDWRLSRYAVNREVRRNPVDVFLIHVLSMPGEFLRGDAQVSSTASRVIFANDALGATDRWNGYALHCVEGANKGYARPITDSTSGTGNYIDVSPAFPNAPASGDEYQIRNSIYDVLPLGWGMGVHHSKIDVTACERTRTRYLADAALGKFMLGDQDDIDLWKTLQENVLTPYQMVPRNNRRSGKLELKYIGEPLVDGVVDDYVAITEEHVLEVGDIAHGASQPLGRVTVKTRKAGSSLVNSTMSAPVTHALDPFRAVANEYARAQSPLFDGAVTSIILQSPEISGAYGASGFTELEISALFNSIDDVEHVLTLAWGLLRREAAPPPSTSLRCTLDVAPYVQAGDLLAIEKDDVLDPFTGTVGTIDVTARVLSARMSLDPGSPGIELGIELMTVTAGARIAPALAVESEGNDANGDYVRCEVDAYTNDATVTLDHYDFVVGDRVELRDKHGALKEDLGTITGFGTGEAAEPEDAVLESSDTLVRIYVSTAATSVAAGDYVTFAQWPNATTRMEDYYSAYAASTGLLNSADAAKRYG